MTYESIDPHKSAVMRDKNRVLGKVMKNALFVASDVTNIDRTISCALTGRHNKVPSLLERAFANELRKIMYETCTKMPTISQGGEGPESF